MKYIGIDHDSYLEHHGVKGMKWGVRRYQNKDGSLTNAGKKRYSEVRQLTTKSGEKVWSVRKKSKDAGSYTYSLISKQSGKKIGDLLLDRESPSSLNINWIGIKPSARGKGYAQAVLKDAERIARRDGYKQLTLEVPGLSPDARHIYEKLGFKESGSISGTDVWGGLTSMKKKLAD